MHDTMDLCRALIFLLLTGWIKQSDSQCSLQITPRMHEYAIMFECGGQCNFATSLQENLCRELLYNELGIEQCDQSNCRPRIYNLRECTSEATRNTTLTCQYCSSGDGEDFTNGLTMEPQECTPTTVYGTVTTSVTVTTTCQPHKINTQGVSCTTTPTPSIIPIKTTANSNTTSSALAALGALVGLLLALLVIVTAAMIWISWKLKMKGEMKRHLQQSRVHNTFQNTTNQNQNTEIVKQLHNPVYGETYPTVLPQNTKQPLSGAGKKAEHTYEVIPLTPTSTKRNPKEKGHDYDRLTRHKVITGHYESSKSSAQHKAGVARKDTKNLYYLMGKDTHKNEQHYSHTQHHPPSSATKKLERSNMYHVLERPPDVNEEPQQRENEYHILEGPTPEEERGGIKRSGGNMDY